RLPPLRITHLIQLLPDQAVSTTVARQSGRNDPDILGIALPLFARPVEFGNGRDRDDAGNEPTFRRSKYILSQSRGIRFARGTRPPRPRRRQRGRQVGHVEQRRRLVVGYG